MTPAQWFVIHGTSSGGWVKTFGYSLVNIGVCHSSELGYKAFPLLYRKRKLASYRFKYQLLHVEGPVRVELARFIVEVNPYNL